MDKLNEVLEILIELVKSTKDFVGEQAPAVAREILNYEFYTSCLCMGYCLIMIPLCFVSAYLIYKANAGLVLLLPIAIFSLSLYGIIANIDTIIKTKVAPRLVVLDYLQQKITKQENKK